METLRSIQNKILTQSLPGKFKSPLTSKLLLFFIFLSLANITLGIILTIIYSNIYTIEIPYQTGSNNLIFNIPKETKNLNLYLQLKNFYSSHTYYAKSYSINQLNGKATQNINSCKPLKYLNGKIIYPCGLIANAFNQDTFRLFKNNIELPIKTDNIAWTSTKNRIKNTSYTLDEIEAPPNWQPYEAVPQLENNLRFANWMQQSSFPSFRKLYGRIGVLEPGDYNLLVQSNYEYGKTGVFITEESWAGTKNYFLSIFMIFVGLCMLFSCFFIYKSQQFFNDA
ncbi:alkylphosphocholine resistance protein lem3 [Gurleya vavrai]